MNQLLNEELSCPYCGENIDVLVDASVDQQSYVEDCSVCCRPILLNVSWPNEDGAPEIRARAENE